MKHTFSSKPSSPTATHKLRSQLNAIVLCSDLLRCDIRRLEDSEMRPKHLPQILDECMDNISEIKQAALQLEQIAKEFRDAAATKPKIKNEEESEERKFESTDAPVIDANDPPSARP